MAKPTVRTAVISKTSISINLTEINCSVYPKCNDWDRLGLDHPSSSLLSPMISPKNVHRILTGPGMHEVCVGCVRMLVHGVQLVRLGSGVEEIVKCQEIDLRDDERDAFLGVVMVCNDNVRKLTSHEPLIGAQFVLHRINHGAVHFTPYVAAELDGGGGFCSVFKHRELGVVFAFDSSTKTPIMSYIQSTGARLDFASTCARCGTAARLSRCAGCRHVAYCSKPCQIADWGTHRAVCGGCGSRRK